MATVSKRPAGASGDASQALQAKRAKAEPAVKQEETDAELHSMLGAETTPSDLGAEDHVKK